MHHQLFKAGALRCAIVVVVLATISIGNAQSPTSDLDMIDRLIAASKIYSLIQQYFAHWEGVPRDEVEAAYREYISRVVQGKSRAEFDLATLRFVAALHNGHTQFFDDLADGRPLKFRLLEVEHQWVVIGSQQRALPRGTVVRTLDGRAVEDAVGELSRYVAASNDRSARTNVFNYSMLFPERVSLGLQDGTTVVVDRSVPADAPIVPLRAAEGRWVEESRIAYIRVPSFGSPVFEQSAIDLVRQFAASPNLIVDVRGNGGGTTPSQLIAALLNRPRRSWQESTPQITVFQAQGFPPLRMSRDFPPQPPSADAYAGRLFVLVDRFCQSACEDFVMPFKDTRRAVVVGETTQGSSGNPYRATLGLGMNVRIGAMRYRFPDGAAFEGIGIAPDVNVERRVSDIVAGRDAVLERAQELAKAPR
jgi:carboxyl-terminal processing protease